METHVLPVSQQIHIYSVDGEPTPSIVFGNHEFSMDVVSKDIPGLIDGMDILDSKDQRQKHI